MKPLNIRNIWSICICFCFMAFNSGCAHITVKKAYDNNTDFSSLKTYDWIRPSEDAIINIDNRNYIESAVNSKLRSLGYEMTSVDPDFLVSIHGGIKTETIGYSLGGHPTMYWGEGRIYQMEQEEGTLVLDLVSSETKKLFWRGIAKHVFRSDPSEENMEKLINRAVSEMLDSFPPDEQK